MVRVVYLFDEHYIWNFKLDIMKKLVFIFSVVFFASCGYKKSIDDKVYIQCVRNGSGPALLVAHSNPNCPELDSYRICSVKDCFAHVVCSKCVKEEDASKILK